ncbi:hypothetical protein M5689_010844 [Euphorbia peplus]|nr:hypothetical protein M5689_010844 [Euphorbia peplus]
MEYTDIQSNSNYLDSSIIFHVLKNVVGFVLYMHQQIPSVLQDISLEYETFKDEYKQLETALAQAEPKASVRRQNLSRRREVKGGIRRLDKLMNTVNLLESALQLIITQVPNLESFLLVLGPSPIRPHHVYELCFSHGRGPVLTASTDFSTTRAAEGISRKAVRTLITMDSGSGSYPGPTKLFLFVKVPSSLNLPLHFLPKRDFRYSKKIVPARLRLKCKSQDLEMDVPDCAGEKNSSISLKDSSSNDLIWFQCRHVIKGLAFTTPTDQE